MKNIGDYTMVTTETIWAGYTTVRGTFHGRQQLRFGRLVNTVSGLSDAAKAFLEASAPPLYFLLFCCSVPVFVIHLPAVYPVYLLDDRHRQLDSQRTDWMCCCPPVGRHPSGNKSGPGKPGRLRLHLPDRQHDQTAADGVRILFASVAIVAGGTILNALFAAALMNVQINSVTGVFSMAGF